MDLSRSISSREILIFGSVCFAIAFCFTLFPIFNSAIQSLHVTVWLFYWCIAKHFVDRFVRHKRFFFGCFFLASHFIVDFVEMADLKFQRLAPV